MHVKNTCTVWTHNYLPTNKFCCHLQCSHLFLSWMFCMKSQILWYTGCFASPSLGLVRCYCVMWSTQHHVHDEPSLPTYVYTYCVSAANDFHESGMRPLHQLSSHLLKSDVVTFTHFMLTSTPFLSHPTHWRDINTPQSTIPKSLVIFCWIFCMDWCVR